MSDRWTWLILIGGGVGLYFLWRYLVPQPKTAAQTLADAQRAKAGVDAANCAAGHPYPGANFGACVWTPNADGTGGSCNCANTAAYTDPTSGRPVYHVGDPGWTVASSGVGTNPPAPYAPAIPGVPAGSAPGAPPTPGDVPKMCTQTVAGGGIGNFRTISVPC